MALSQTDTCPHFHTVKGPQGASPAELAAPSPWVRMDGGAWHSVLSERGGCWGLPSLLPLLQAFLSPAFSQEAGPWMEELSEWGPGWPGAKCWGQAIRR